MGQGKILTQKPKIVIKRETKEKLDELGKKNETYDDIITKLIKAYPKKDGVR